MPEDIIGMLIDDLLPSGGAVVTLRAFMDKGAKEDRANGVMCVAAAMFKPMAYKQFRRKWDRMLDGWGAKVFHATDFYGGGGEFKRTLPGSKTLDPELVARQAKDSRLIPDLVATHVHELFVISFLREEYEHMAPLAWRQQFGGVHRVAAQMMAGRIGHWANKSSFNGDILYFFETGDEEEAQVKDAYDRLWANPKDREHCRMAATPVGVGKEKAVRGLEVADFLAWQWNKFYADTLAVDLNPRPPRKDMSALHNKLEVRGKKVNVHLFTNDALDDFLLANGCTRTEKG